ncbi:hypothetical protein jhhlp_000757 [Lomentospora prolificans]|uniref:Ig-like domain-containing protein n=1 Tax=Lomentospora prolificans TaxID=41688 RepID=A0A2N3NJB8_9PEZI|nr:hypothetical protein jhhlp_000757 [Lomentospora prolificans]
MMRFSLLAALSLAGLTMARQSSVSGQIKTMQVQTVNGTVEYSTFCQKCPYTICTHLEVPSSGTDYDLTCWTYGDLVGDSQLWLKTSTGCYVSEYDLVEYEGEIREDLAACGPVPKEITEQPAQVRYLTECKWGYSAGAESVTYYGRDRDLTLLCWAEGGNVIPNTYWYKTTDNCYVSGSGLWEAPDQSKLENCGPSFGPQVQKPPNIPVDKPTRASEEEQPAEDSTLAKRWLAEALIGEEYSYCRTCPSAVNTTCETVKTYEYNQTVITQCVAGNKEGRWMLTTDWCYVNATEFWNPPGDNEWGRRLLGSVASAASGGRAAGLMPQWVVVTSIVVS